MISSSRTGYSGFRRNDVTPDPIRGGIQAFYQLIDIKAKDTGPPLSVMPAEAGTG
jgi:hypothetical protein